MSIAIIELNDSEIRLATGNEILLRHPGYAVLKDGSVHTGVPALQIARSNPRQSYNRYWSQLNQDLLIVPSPLARHHADLAYAQLLALHEQAGKPEEVIFAVPGSYSREQLAMLLGIVQACPFRAVGLVDTATASVAAIAGAGSYTHVDIHLHYAVLSTLEIADRVTRTAVKIIHDTGLADIHDTCAACIADAFIDQSRFDPLHHAETEQDMYNRLPQILRGLQDNNELDLELSYKNKRYQTKLYREALLEKLKPHYAHIYRESTGQGTTLISDRLDRLPGFTRRIDNAVVLDEQAVFQGCNLNLTHIRTTGPSLSFVTTLPATATPHIAAGPGMARTSSAITHILVNHRAYALGSLPLYVSASGTLVNGSDSDNRHCSFRLSSAGVEIRPESDLTVFINGTRLAAMKSGAIGDTISFAGSDTMVRLIEVARG